MYSAEEFDKQKTKVLKYIIYKKRTESEIKRKFVKEIDDIMLDDIIEYLKEAGYIDDYSFVEKQVEEYIALKTLSIKEIKYKLYSKGIEKNIIEKFVEKNYDRLYEYEKNSIKKIIDKKSSTMDENEIKQYLYRKGFNCD